MRIAHFRDWSVVPAFAVLVVCAACNSSEQSTRQSTSELEDEPQKQTESKILVSTASKSKAVQTKITETIIPSKVGPFEEMWSGLKDLDTVYVITSKEYTEAIYQAAKDGKTLIVKVGIAPRRFNSRVPRRMIPNPSSAAW